MIHFGNGDKPNTHTHGYGYRYSGTGSRYRSGMVNMIRVGLVRRNCSTRTTLITKQYDLVRAKLPA